MKEVTLVGGAGYVGSRLRNLLHASGWCVEVIDPCILGEVPFPVDLRDVRDVPSSEFHGKTVVYLVAPRRIDHDEDLNWEWAEVFKELLIVQPRRIARACSRFIYLSSMRALTLWEGWDCYPSYKRRGELVLMHDQKSSIIRPGTVWGDLGTDLPSCLVTVPNKSITTGWVPDENYKVWTAHMGAVLWAIQDHLFSPGSTVGEVANVVDLPHPTTAEELVDLTAGSFEPPGAPDLGPHPMEAWATYYGKPWHI